MPGEDKYAWKLKCEPPPCEDIKCNPEAPCNMKCVPEAIATNVTNATIISESEAVKRDPEPIREIIKCPPKCIPDSPSQVIRDDGTDPTSESFKSSPESTCNVKYCTEQCSVPGSTWKVKSEPAHTSEIIKSPVPSQVIGDDGTETSSEPFKSAPVPIETNVSNATIILEGEAVKRGPEPTRDIVKSPVPSQFIGNGGTEPTSEPFKSAPESTCNVSCGATNIFDSIAKGEK